MSGEGLKKYVVKQKIREIGGYLAIFKAHQRVLERDVELRVLQALVDESSDVYAKFHAECKALASLDHPGILKILDLGHSGERIFYVTDPPPGISLKDYLAQGQAPPDVAIEIGVQLGQALDHLHGRGLLHRGLSLAGINYDLTTGRVVICDFSLLKSVTGGGAPSMRDLVDTDTFEALPERARNWPIDARSDVFLAGSLLYALLAGFDPLAPAHLTRTPDYTFEPPGNYNPDCPPELDKMVLHALELEPANRHQTAADFVRDIESVRRKLTVRKASRTMPKLELAALQPSGASPVQATPAESARLEVKPTEQLPTQPRRSRLAELTGYVLDSQRTLGLFAGGGLALILCVFVIRSLSSGGGKSDSEASTAPSAQTATFTAAPSTQTSAGKVMLGSQPDYRGAEPSPSSDQPPPAPLGIDGLIAEAKREPTSQKTFSARWEALRSWSDDQPTAPGATPAFSPMDLTTVRLKIYRDSREACIDLDDMIKKAEETAHK